MPVNVHDFMNKELGKAIPYGVYDLADNGGWVSGGANHDTAEFAVDAVRPGGGRKDRAAYPGASRILITADGGGSNGYRVRT